MRRFVPFLLFAPYILVILGIWQSIPLLTTGSFLLWIIASILLLATRTFLAQLPSRLWFAGLTLLASFIILHTGVYIIYASTVPSILATLGLITLGIIGLTFIPQTRPIFTPLHHIIASFVGKKRIWSPLDIRDGFFAGVIIIVQCTLIYTVYNHRVYDTLVSPWQSLGKNFLLWYAGVTALLIFFSYVTTRSRLAHCLAIVHYFVTFGIVGLLYPLGFGYDPFLHRATEQHIFSFGFIEPRTPFYIGQYVLVNLWAHLTIIPLKLIDIWLVPILTCLLLPTATYLGLHYGWRLSARIARIGVLLIPLYPLETLYVTTPHNLANLLVFATIMLLPMAKHRRATYIPLALLCLAAVVVHPLTGIFACAATALFWLSTDHKTWRLSPRIRLSLITIIAPLTLVSIALFFALYLTRQHIPLPSLTRIISEASQFRHLVHDPYYYSQGPVPWVFDVIYWYKRLIPLLLASGALLGYIILKRDRAYLRITFFVSMACLINAYLLTTWIEFPSLNMYEQLQYGERLMHVAFFFLVPGSIACLLSLIERQLYRIRPLLFVVASALALLLTTSLYLTYPQFNPKVHFPGFNVTAADIAVADTLASQTSTSYIVLSNILTAAASVETYGFRTYYTTPTGPVFYYAIPSGGPLATAFNTMLYQGQHRETMTAALAQTGATHGYFVVHSYWDNAANIVLGATQTADSVVTTTSGNTTLWIFSYDSTSTSSVHISPTPPPKK